MVDQLARLPESAWSDALIDGLQRASDGIPRRILHLLATLLREGLLLERPVGWTPGGSEEGLRERLAKLGPNGLLSWESAIANEEIDLDRGAHDRRGLRGFRRDPSFES